ncbi:pyridoxamine phosphate [Nannochloropsis gaditana CCMP526]|uniref:pyridoxamine phosphate n=1 Tax=Nannochloropsis gaditana (strain CCMP526) TaxID=1093141 RepID=UPI00029F612E|nr:pyridoxamine phosphate [Nannochloropsis gaditana CCMP526]EKU20406.1 pyridoxamine phosphate [Nannochloropsis gaditana CCMP526]|eukprot:XP_005855963.1 pyridoxamine phosphate [Nannochloropsis gaditana CCMP526]
MVSDPVEGKEDIFPPLPPTVVALLQSTRVCHLSTASTDGLPHLSLMRFTYRREEEVIIMTTRTDTKKYELLCSMPKVAVLGEKGGGVGGNEDGGEGGSKRPHRHEKEDGKGGGGKGKEGGDGDGHTYAITLNGVARMETGEEAERYRSLHLKNNVAYSQFIEGPGIAVFTVHVMSARICNVKDRVTYWDKRTATVEEGVRREEKGEGRGKRQEE